MHAASICLGGQAAVLKGTAVMHSSKAPKSSCKPRVRPRQQPLT